MPQKSHLSKAENKKTSPEKQQHQKITPFCPHINHPLPKKYIKTYGLFLSRKPL